MKISKMNHATAFCIALLAVSFIIGTAAGSILLAAIPPQNTQSNVYVETPGGNQVPDEAEPGSQGTQAHKESKYALVCGVAVVKADKANVKPSPPPPPPRKDKNGRLGSCFLLDVSTSKASIVHGELQASELIHKVDPIYPDPAVKEHVGIRVTLHINVNEEGIVTDAEVTKSQTVPPDRDSKGNWVGGANPSVIRATNSAAIDAAKQWEYSPTLLNGNAVPVRATASITFTFNEDGSPKIIVYAP